MIVVQLSGGLGNQMFQYALGRKLAETQGCHVKLDITNYEKYSDRKYELPRLNVCADIASSFDLQRCKGYGFGGRIVVPLFAKLLPGISVKVVSEKSISFDSSVLHHAGNGYLIGYWQNEQYFYDIREVLRKELTLKGSLDEENRLVDERIRTANSVAIHVRRGDYVSDPSTVARMESVGEEYYSRATNYVLTRVSNPHFFVFSDDPAWAMANLRFQHPVTFVSHNGPDDGVLDLHLMSACKHNIIANSTFSWWAAWLNSNPEKVVVAPRHWYKGVGLQAMGLLSEGWVAL